MTRIRFKQFQSVDVNGKPTVYHLNGFDAAELLTEIRNQRDGVAVHLHSAYTIYLLHAVELIEDSGGLAAAQFGNLGFVAAVQSLGFKIYVCSTDFEIAA